MLVLGLRRKLYIYSPLFSFALTGVGEDVGEGVGS